MFSYIFRRHFNSIFYKTQFGKIAKQYMLALLQKIEFIFCKKYKYIILL